MYTLTEDILNLFAERQRQVLRITFTGADGTVLNLTESNVIQNGMVIDRYCMSGNTLELGSAVSAELTLRLKNYDGSLDDVVFEGGEFFVELGIKDWSDDTVEVTYLPMGYYIVDEAPRKLTTITVSALDRMVLLDKSVDWSLFSFPMDIMGMVELACSTCGVTLGQTSNDRYLLPNCGYDVADYPTTTDITYRTLIRWAAFAMGTCAQMDNNGELVFRWYEQTDFAVTPSTRYSSDLYDNDVSIDGIEYTSSSTVVYSAGDCTNPITFSDCGLLQDDIQEAIDAIWESIGAMSYRPYEATVKPAPFLDPLDMIQYADSKGVVHATIVSHITFTSNLSTSIAGKGETNTSASYSDPEDTATTAMLRKVTSYIEQTETGIKEYVASTYATQEAAAQILLDAQAYADDTLSQITLTVSGIENTVSGTIKGVSVLYASGESSSEAPTEGWSTTSPDWIDGMYIWQKTVTTKADGTTEESTPVCITGATGATGSPGSSGSDGEDGLSYVIESTNGYIYEDAISTVLTARIYSGSEEIDADGELTYEWYLKGVDDEDYSYYGSGKSITLSLEDTYASVYFIASGESSSSSNVYLVDEDGNTLTDENGTILLYDEAASTYATDEDGNILTDENEYILTM